MSHAQDFDRDSSDLHITEGTENTLCQQTVHHKLSDLNTELALWQFHVTLLFVFSVQNQKFCQTSLGWLK